MPIDMESGRWAVRRGAARVGAWLVGAVLVLLVGAGYVFITRTRDVQVRPARLVGGVWSGVVDGATRVYYMTREDRAETRAFDSDGAYTFQHSYSVFVLHARSAADGAAVGEVRIARLETTSPDFAAYAAYRTMPDGPGILGPQGDVLWLWNSGPEARDLRTLGPVWTAGQLRSRMAQGAAVFPDDPRYAKVIGPLGALVLKGTDARYVRVDRATGGLVPVEEGALAALSREPARTADAAFRSLVPGGAPLRPASMSGLIVNDVLDDGSWYALLADDQRAGLREYRGAMEEWDLRVGIAGESSAMLYGARYALVPESNVARTAIRLDLASVAPRGSARYLSAGFLRRPGTGAAWEAGPARAAAPGPGAGGAGSYIVLHRRALGESGAWLLTRVGTDGVELWTCDTGLGEVREVCDGGTSIVLFGAAPDSRAKELWPERMVFVDVERGVARVVEVTGGEVSAAG